DISLRHAAGLVRHASPGPPREAQRYRGPRSRMTTYDDTMDHARPATRFVAFGLAVLIGVGVLGARLFYLEGTNGARIVPPMTTRPTVVEALPSSRGLIYDRAGRPLVANVPVYAVKIRPADLPLPRRPAVIARLAAMI